MVFLYDSLITTGEEVRCFWGRKVTGAAILFWLNKYLTALYFILNFGSEAQVSDSVRAIPSVSAHVTLTDITSLPEVSDSHRISLQISRCITHVNLVVCYDMTLYFFLPLSGNDKIK